MKSMTAFVRHDFAEAEGNGAWEIKTLNHRHCEVSVRLPEGLASLELPIRKHLQQAFSRGKIDCQLRFMPQQASATLSLEETQLTALSEALAHVTNLLGDRAGKVDPIQLLRWPGLVREPTLSLDALEPLLLAQLTEAIHKVTRMRQEEGDALRSYFDTRLAAMAEKMKIIEARLPGVQTAQRETLLARFQEAGVTYDADRLEQELVLLAQRGDVAEEVSRLQAHWHALKETFSQDTPAGRRMDFLLQECHREINTLGTKCQDVAVKQETIALKLLVEQLREQCHNIE